MIFGRCSGPDKKQKTPELEGTGCVLDGLRRRGGSLIFMLLSLLLSLQPNSNGLQPAIAMASNLLAMASKLLAMASNLRAIPNY